MNKTNAMRILDQHSIPYMVHEYPHKNEAVDGIHVASLLNQNVEQVYKTLVLISNTRQYFVFMIPVVLAVTFIISNKKSPGAGTPGDLFFLAEAA